MNQHILKPTISAEDVIRWRCCYEHSRVRALLPEPQSIIDLLKRSDVPPKDRVWLATRPGFLSDWVLFNFAANCADRALRAAKVTDERCWRSVEHARERARGAKRDNEIVAAVSAARDAAYDAAHSAYDHDAARARARAAYAAHAAAADCANAYDAACAANKASYYATHACGDSKAERAEQITDLLRLIESGDAASVQPLSKAGGEA